MRAAIRLAAGIRDIETCPSFIVPAAASTRPAFRRGPHPIRRPAQPLPNGAQ